MAIGPDPVQRGRQVVLRTLLTGGILLVTGLPRAGFVARFVAPEALRASCSLSPSF